MSSTTAIYAKESIRPVSTYNNMPMTLKDKIFVGGIIVALILVIVMGLCVSMGFGVETIPGQDRWATGGIYIASGFGVFFLTIYLGVYADL